MDVQHKIDLDARQCPEDCWCDMKKVAEDFRMVR